MWTPEKKFCVAAIKSWLNGTTLPVYSISLSVKKVVDCAEANGVACLLFHAYRLPNNHLLPEELFQGLFKRYVANLTVNMLLTAELLKIGERCRGLKPVLIKGAVLAKPLYGDPALRPLSDVDIYVNASEKEKFLGLVYDAGFKRHGHYQHLFSKANLLLDVHSDLFNIERIRSRRFFLGKLPPLGLRSSSQYPGFYEPDTLTHVIFLTYHNIKHSFEKWIWGLDLLLLLRREWPNKTLPEIEEMLAPFQMQGLFSYTRHILENLWVPKTKFSTLPRGFLEKIAIKALLEDRKIDSLGAVLLGLQIPSWPNRLRYFLEIIFPRREVLGEMAERAGEKVGFYFYLLRFFKICGQGVKWLMAGFSHKQDKIDQL